MTTVDTSFLKDEVGPVLARGIAETIVAAPKDPVEYLGLWLQHYLEEKEAEAADKEKEEERRVKREERNKHQASKEKTASEVIQREWKLHLAKVEARSEREAELRTRLESFGDQLDEEGAYDPDSIGYDALGDQEAGEEEKEKELEMLKTERLFQRWREYMKELTKENIADVKAKSSATIEVQKVVRCVFYLIGKLPVTRSSGEKLEATPSRLATWAQLRANIKPHPFLEMLKSFDPTTAAKRRVVRVRRIMNSLQGADETLKASGGQIVYVISQWIWAAVTYRTIRDEVFKAKKEAGKEIPGMDSWDEDAGDEVEGEEKDADEETEKQLEEQTRKEQEDEAAEEEEPAGGE